MNRFRIGVGLLTALVTAGAAPGLEGGGAASAKNQQTVEGVITRVTEIMAKHKSLSYLSELKFDYQFPQYSSKGETRTQCEYVKRGLSVIFRQDTTTTQSTKTAGTDSKMTIKSLVVGDGEFVYSLSDTNDQKTAVKQRYNPTIVFNPFDQRAAYEQSKQQFDYRLLPDETVGGKPCWVFELKPKDPVSAAQMIRTLMYIEQESGVAVKNVSFDKDNKQTGLMTTTHIQFDAAVPDDHFVFKAPAGVTVQDLSRIGQPDAASPQTGGQP
ncbi:MAG: outer membrane lipoprotein-sorting protein [Phycisphaerae bacterium]